MKNLFYLTLLTMLICAFTAYSQDDAQSYFPDRIFTQADFVPGDSCAVLNPERHDDFTHENGYRQSAAGADSTRFVIKMRPNTVPWTYTKVCIGWTKTGSPGTINYDIVVYDTLGPGGAPGSLLMVIPGQSIANVPVFPAMIWNSSVVSIPVSASLRAVYIGARVNFITQTASFMSADQTPPLWPGYLAIGSPPVWQTIQTLFSAYTCMCIRTEGQPAGSQNYMGTWPTPGVNTNYIAIPHQASMIGFGNNITIEGWVRVGSTTAPSTVLNKGAGSFDYQLGINTGGLPFFRAQGVVANGTVPVVQGVWTHVAVVSNGTTVTFFINGLPGPPQPVVTTLGASANEMRVGRGNNDPCSGNMEEVRLWSVLRTQNQIETDRCRKYPSGFISNTGLKAVWHLDNNTVDSVSGYNGNIMGTVTFDTVSFPIPGVSCTVTGIEPVNNTIPNVYSLEQNYPNPFNPTTNIKFSIPKGGFVELKIFDLLGREVATLVQDPFEAGTYRVDFDGTKLASGVYLYQIKVGSDFVDTKKMVLVK